MKAEIDSGARPAAPPRNANATGGNSGSTTPKKSKTAIKTPKKEKTLAGRVTKCNNTTPKKLSNGDAATGIKQEHDSSAGSFSMMDEADAEGEADGEGEELMDGNEFFNMSVEGEEGY